MLKLDGLQVTTMLESINVPVGSIVVTDANLCTETLSHTITESSDLEVVLDSAFDLLLCQGDDDGTINITASGGTIDYSYLWSTADGDLNGQETSEDLVGLTGGTYELVVTDANGCTETLSHTINEASELEVILDSSY